MGFNDDNFLDDYEIQELINKFENQFESGMSMFFDADEHSHRSGSLPLTREVDFAKQKTEGEKIEKAKISPSVSFADSSLVRGSQDGIIPLFMRFLTK